MNDIATSKFGHGGLQYTLSDGDLQPLGKRILVSKMQFGEKKTQGGIILTDDDGKGTGIHTRWCQVYAVGPKQEDVTVGQWLLIAHGRWSRAFKINKPDSIEIVRMIDENEILLVSDETPSDVQ